MPIWLIGGGDEAAAQFSVGFDTNALEFQSGSLGSASASATLNLNPTNGSVGVTWSMPIGTGLSAGTNQLVNLTFRVRLDATSEPGLNFSGSPIPALISDTLANEAVPSLEVGGVYMNWSYPQLTIERWTNDLLLLWPLSVTGFGLQSTEPAPMFWTNQPGVTNSINGSNAVVLPLDEAYKLFRLRKP